MQCLKTNLNRAIDRESPNILCMSEHGLTMNGLTQYQRLNSLSLVKAFSRVRHTNSGVAVCICQDLPDFKIWTYVTFVWKWSLKCLEFFLGNSIPIIVLSIYRSPVAGVEAFLK